MEFNRTTQPIISQHHHCLVQLDVTRTTRNSHKNKSSALMMSSIGINRKNRTQGRKNKRRRRKNLCKFLQVFFFYYYYYYFVFLHWQISWFHNFEFLYSNALFPFKNTPNPEFWFSVKKIMSFLVPNFLNNQSIRLKGFFDVTTLVPFKDGRRNPWLVY